MGGTCHCGWAEGYCLFSSHNRGNHNVRVLFIPPPCVQSNVFGPRGDHRSRWLIIIIAAFAILIVKAYVIKIELAMLLTIAPAATPALAVVIVIVPHLPPPPPPRDPPNHQ